MSLAEPVVSLDALYYSTVSITTTGFGTKGRAAVETLIARGTRPSEIVVIDQHADAIEDATRTGLAAVHGSAGRASPRSRSTTV